MGERRQGPDEPIRLRPDEPSVHRRALLAQQRAQFSATAADLEAQGDQAGAKRLRDQVASIDGVLSGAPEEVDQWTSATLMRGLLAQAIGRAEVMLSTAEAMSATRALAGLRQAVADGQAALDRSPAELARAAVVENFLGRLEGQLILGDRRRLAWRRRIIEPFGVTGLVVTAAGVPGRAMAVPVARAMGPAGGRLVYGDAADADALEYELRVTDGAADAWPSRPSVHLISPDAATIVAAILAWRDATPLPPPVIRPLDSADLAPLRALAAARRVIEAAARAGADWATLGLALAFDPVAPVEVRRRDDPATGGDAATGLAALTRLFGQADEANPVIADWLAHVASGPVVTPPASLTKAGAAALADDLAAIDAARLLANVPRDTHGRLELEHDVLLAAYETVYGDEPAGRRARLWLVARLPARRRDPQVVTLALDLLLGDGRRHRWDAARWLWDGRVAADESTRWGVVGLATQRLGLTGRAEEIARLRAERDRGGLSPTARVALVILLQDEGELVEAFQTSGVGLDPALLDLLAGDLTANLTAKEALTWPPAVRDALRAAAPWRFEALLRADEGRRAASATGKRGRTVRPARARLLALPNQPQVRKTSIMLVRGDDGAPLLELETTGADAIAPEVSWRRPLDLDLVRFGLTD